MIQLTTENKLFSSSWKFHDSIIYIVAIRIEILKYGVFMNLYVLVNK